jgi:formylmethanofuran dehydrogenase subunit E
MTGQVRGEPVECPFCGEPTMPNRLSDGSVVCSCAAERSLPAAPLAPGAARPTSRR